MFGYTNTYGWTLDLLFKIVFWPLAIVRKQREEVPRHVKLQLGGSSFVEVISKDYLQQRAIHVTAALSAQPRSPLIYLLVDVHIQLLYKQLPENFE